ncbi:MAG: diguanylate cyclase [Aestuariibacter sp.]
MTDFSAELNLKTLLEHAHIGVVIHRWDTSVVYANPTALKLLRLTHEQIIGKDAYDPQWSFLDEAGKKLPVEEFPVSKVKQSKGRLNNEIMGVIDSTSEDISWFMINAYFEGNAGDVGFIIITFNDISEMRDLFSFQDIVENTQDIVIVTEANDINYPTGPKIIYVNKAFEELTGYKQSEVIGESPRILQGDLTDKEATTRIHNALQEQKAITETLLNYDSSGRPYWIEMNIIPLRNKYNEVTHFAAIERDVSERKFQQEQLEKRNKDLKVLKQNLELIVEERTMELQKAKAQLETIAFFDPLTNIPNRRFFIDQANKLVKSSSRHDFAVAFGLLDIDNFKQLNDSHGHDVGDAVLVELANALTHIFRSDDAFCRYGGEEFAFAFSIKQNTDVEVVADRLLSAIRSITVQSENKNLINITASLGIKITQPDSNTDLEQEVKHADMAMYKAKTSGKDQYCIFSE